MALNRIELRLTDATLKQLKKLKGARSYSTLVTELISAAASENPRDLKGVIAKALVSLNRILSQQEKTIVDDIVLSPVPAKILTVLAKDSGCTKAEIIEHLLYDQARVASAPPCPSPHNKLNE